MNNQANDCKLDETPETDWAWEDAKHQTDPNEYPDWSWIALDMRNHAMRLEKQLNAANARIKELEDTIEALKCDARERD